MRSLAGSPTAFVERQGNGLLSGNLRWHPPHLIMRRPAGEGPRAVGDGRIFQRSEEPTRSRA